jgi:adenosine deaminase
MSTAVPFLTPVEPVPADIVRRAPKVLLHDHLDGGLRPATVLELAQENGHALPEQTVAGLARWFRDAADSGSLERYLETFAHTVGVMQTRDALVRWPRSARRTPPTASSTPRCASPRAAHP